MKHTRLFINQLPITGFVPVYWLIRLVLDKSVYQVLDVCIVGVLWVIAVHVCVLRHEHDTPPLCQKPRPLQG